MAGAGFKTFVDGDVLTAAEVNTFLMQQAVMVFDDATARSSVLAAPTEGMVTYLKDTNAVEKYDGSSWVAVITLDLDDLGDVDAGSPSDGQVLTYNNTSGKWEPAVPPTAASPIGLILALGG